ncbi:MAG: hypothetical protein FJX72_13985 [Armatimonadetes bacterium]|nr:hypothetical protein [Armatimonadota bacterium]
MGRTRRVGWTPLVAVLGFGALMAGAAVPQDAVVQFQEIVFAVRASVGPHWYENFGFYSNEPEKPAFAKGGMLCAVNPSTGAMRTLVKDPTGGVRDPQLHYDGQKILFSYRKGDEPAYHLYEINVDGTGLKQLTDGPDDDIEPCYLPDGGIAFVSSRCHRFVNCWYTRVATLYRCDGDGTNIRALSANIEHDNTPWVMPDGRLLYMRWEYVDRSQVHFHHLWTMNPDGTNQTVFYGNLHGGVAMLGAKPIPGTRQVVAAFSPDHGLPEHMGEITIVDPDRGPDDRGSARRVSRSPWYKDPYALGGGRFLASFGRRIVEMDETGAEKTLFSLPESIRMAEIHEPRPIAARPREPVISSRVDFAKLTGTLVLEDIYVGRNMAGVQPGEIKELLVFEQLPKPVNFSGGMEPLSMGGTFTLARCLGTVPVEPDGSANIEVPAQRPLFFVALDANRMAVKRMQSWVSVQPGERLSCVGCHEQRVQTPRSVRNTTALRKPPSKIAPLVGLPDVPDFPRDVQPVLDRHCVSCHSPNDMQARVDLSGDHTAWYSMAYETMIHRGLISDGRNLPRGNRAPREIGSSASRLLKLMDGSHHGATPTEREFAIVRLWIEAGATYPGTYASLGCGMVGVPLPVGRLFERCGPCHSRPEPGAKPPRNALYFGPGSSVWPGVLCNLSRPEMSRLLVSPLSKQAGGRGACGEQGFASKDDPLYGMVLASIRDAAATLDREKRFDMPGFRPNPHYIREMQRFGALPERLDPDRPFDPYKIDRAYWDSFIYIPIGMRKDAHSAR